MGYCIAVANNKESLGKDELEEICSQGRGPREQWLWYYFTTYIDQ